MLCYVVSYVQYLHILIKHNGDIGPVCPDIELCVCVSRYVIVCYLQTML